MKRIFNSNIIILLVFLVAACKVSKDIQQEAPKVPTTFRNATNTDTTTIADLPWNSFFADAALRSLIDSAIRNNYDMQLAVKNIESAQLRTQQIKWAYFPDARLQVTASTSNPSNNSLNGLSASQFLQKSHIEDYNAQVALSWEADIWGKIKNTNAAVVADYLQTKEAKNAIQTNLVANVAQGYYNLVMLDAQLAIAQKNLLLADSSLRIIKLQFGAAQVTQLAVQQAEAQRLVAAELVPQFQQDIAIQENALSILTGAMPKQQDRGGSLDEITLSDNLSAGLPASLVSRRPDVRSIELELDKANARVGIAKANMYPSFGITALGGVNSFRASNWFNIPASLFGTLAGGITQPLFQRKQLSTQYEISKVEREKAVLLFRQSVLGAVGEVSDALVKIEQLKNQQAITANRVSTLQQAIGNAGLLFKNGLANYLEVIVAQSNVLQSELQLATIKRLQLGATVELYRSLGGGWK